MNTQIMELIGEYLDLLLLGRASQEENESTLEHLLDEIAVTLHNIDFNFDKAKYPDPPEWPYAEWRAIAQERFPEYGIYNVPETISEQVGQAKLIVGDSIDDIVDIGRDLADVAWYWDNTSKANALWHLEYGFKHHWGRHLRSLQLYIYCQKNGW